MPKLPSTRKEAKAAGSSYYFTGKPCKRGHTDKRRTSNASCVACNAITSGQHYQDYRDHHRARIAAHKKRNPGQYAAYEAKRRAAKLKRTPAWADMEMIAMWYERSALLTAVMGTPHHCDHIIPLQGTHVSGLHVESNLAILDGPDNASKSNSWDLDANHDDVYLR